MLRKSPHWTLLLEGDHLVASAGADELYLVDEVDGEGARALFAAWQDDDLDGVAGGALAPALEMLARVGVVSRDRARSAGPLRFAVRGAPEGFAPLLDALVPEGITRVDEADAPVDLLVWVRARASLLEMLGDYRTVRVPHLLVDLAYHHTLCLGPLVWPGETACLGCFGGRIRQVWGDPSPPELPRALAVLPLAASLVATELAVLRERGSCPALVERSIAFDLETLGTRAERVHRLPWCPFCFPPGTEHGTGSFALPWASP